MMWRPRQDCKLANKDMQLVARTRLKPLIDSIRFLEALPAPCKVRLPIYARDVLTMTEEEEKMAKIAFNNCYGGFGLSLEAQKLYLEKKGHKPVFHDGEHSWDKRWTCSEHPDFHDSDIARDDPALIEVIEELGERAAGDCAKLAIEEVETGTLWRIDEYDGNESIMTQDSYEWNIAK